MKKINTLALATALGLTFAGVVQAAWACEPVAGRTIVTRRTVAAVPVMPQQQIVTQRTTTVRTATVQTGMPAVAVSGATLSGRREIISRDAVFVPDGGRGRVVWSDGGGWRSRPARDVISESDLTTSPAFTTTQPSIAFGGTSCPIDY